MTGRDPLPQDLQERANITEVDTGLDGKPSDETTPTTPSAPILRELPAALAFPVDALPVTTGRIVREAAAAIGFPPDLIAGPLLVTLSAGIGASRVVQLKLGWWESATLYMATVFPPGTKKTPAAKVATAPAWKKQMELRKNYRKLRQAYMRPNTDSGRPINAKPSRKENPRRSLPMNPPWAYGGGLGKMVYAISGRSTWLKAEPGSKKNEEG